MGHESTLVRHSVDTRNSYLSFAGSWGFRTFLMLTPISGLRHVIYSIISPCLINGLGKLEVWNYPSGGRLIPPDLFSMIFASPWLGLGFGRGVAYDLSIVTHIICNVVAGWYLGKKTGSPWSSAVALLCAPFCIGQLNSGETETIGLWGLTLCLATLHQHRWIATGFFGPLSQQLGLGTTVHMPPLLWVVTVSLFIFENKSGQTNHH